MIKDFFCNGFAKALNHYLQLDPATFQRLEKLDGKVATIAWPSLHFVFQCRFTKEAVFISADEILAGNVKISGTPWQMFNMMMAKDRQRFFMGELEIKGDMLLGQQVLALFDEMQWDAEEYISRFIGDIPAHQLGRVSHQLKNIWQQTKRSLTENVSEYLHEEIKWFPPREALEDFFTDVDKLRMDVDRMTARVHLFMQNIKNMEKL